ncbi:MerR family transcriptional regulator [Streptomyces lydicus]|uniref:MerR family transcriptional regulator n=1 Tax=Streptomyces lydicus TaxID=47763 RepID=UPI0037A8168E
MPPHSTHPLDKLDDDNYPAHTTGRAADILDTTPTFLRTLGDHHLITPLRSQSDHRHYTHHQLRIAAHTRQLAHTDTPTKTACHITTPENQLQQTQHHNQQPHTHHTNPPHPGTERRKQHNP